MQRLPTAGRWAPPPGIRVSRAPGFGASRLRHSPTWGVSSRQEGPRWLKEPAGVLQQLAASPTAEDIPTRQPADVTAVVYKLRLGGISEQVAGAYGSQDRLYYEQGLARELYLSPAYGYDEQQGANAIVHGIRFEKQGSQQAALVFTACRGNTPAAVRARTATESWVREGLKLGGQSLRLAYAPGQQPAGTRRVLLQNLPPALAVKGVVPAVLSCAGYEAAQVQVEAEFLGACKLQGQVVPGLGSLDTIVAWVASPQSDTALRQLPDQFRVGDSTVRVQVEGRTDSRRHQDFFSWEAAEPRGPQQEQLPDPYSLGILLYEMAPDRFPNGPQAVFDWPPQPPAGPSPLAAAAAAASDMEMDPPIAPPGLRGFSAGHGAVATGAADQQVAGTAVGSLAAAALAPVGPVSMDMDRAAFSPAPGPFVSRAAGSQGATALSDLGSMHASRQARLQELLPSTPAPAQQQRQQTHQQQQPGGHRQTARAPPPPQQPQASPSARVPAARGPATHICFDTWAAGAAAREILSVLGFALDDMPRVEEAGGKPAAFRAFYGFCTRGPQELQLLSSWQQEWEQQVPGVQDGVPSWVTAWVQRNYGEQGYGSSGSSDQGGSPRGRPRQHSGGRPRGRGAAAAAITAARARPTPAGQSTPSSAQPSSTLRRSGRKTRKPDPDRQYGGGGHA